MIVDPSQFSSIRHAISTFDLSSRVEPNETIEIDRAYLPEGHRGVLDLRRQLVVGNRGMGKSFWTHALLNGSLRELLAKRYRYPALEKATVVIGFNGSTKIGEFAPTPDELADAIAQGVSPDTLWRAVLMRAANYATNQKVDTFSLTLSALQKDPSEFTVALSKADDILVKEGRFLLIVFDALDRLARNWHDIRALTKELLYRAVGLQSFSSIRMKIFMREDQFSDQETFRFTDSSKIKNDYVRLVWKSFELYGLLIFEILRTTEGKKPIIEISKALGIYASSANSNGGNIVHPVDQGMLVNSLAGEFMGTNKKRGRVYTWIPRHLGDAKHTCSPRTFLTAWKTAAEHAPAPVDRVVDHQGLNEGVRRASQTRLSELYEDYPWIQPTLDALRAQFVPIEKQTLFDLWEAASVRGEILTEADTVKAPVGFTEDTSFNALLNVMESVGVMEERANGKINVPDIFRVDAKIKRKGGVSLPPGG